MSSPAKLFSYVQATQICRSPLNLSSAKQQYSFSRSQRFKTPNPYCDSIYNLPNTRTRRHTSFGYGKKTDLDHNKTPHNETPSPANYKLDSFVETNHKHKRGMTTHIGRDLTTPGSYIQLDPTKFPGPGCYNQYRFNDTPKWSMRRITNPELFDKTTQDIVPGPNTSNFTQEISSKGRYYAAKYKNSGAQIWNPPSSQRFSKSNTEVPGSGHYHPVNEMSDSGKYVLSTQKGSGRRKLDQQYRESFLHVRAKTVKTPGPGSYRMPSQFGQYDHPTGVETEQLQ